MTGRRGDEMKITFRDDREIARLREEVASLRMEWEYAQFKFRYFEDRLTYQSGLNNALRDYLKSKGHAV